MRRARAAVALFLAIGTTAWGQDDVVVAVLDAPLAVVVTKGATVPFNGVLLSDAQAVAKAQELAACQGTLANAQAPSKALVTAPVLAAVIAGAILTSLAVGYGVRAATSK